MSPSSDFLKMVVSPVGLRCLQHKDNVLKGRVVERPVLTLAEAKSLERLEFECILSGQQGLRKMYKSFRDEALVV